MILLTGLYCSGNAARDEELRRCYDKNVANPAFSEIYLFHERKIVLSDEWQKLFETAESRRTHFFIEDVGQRMTYLQYFKYANTLFKPGTLVCLANSDIFFKASIGLVKPQHLDKKVMCLSRWGFLPNGQEAIDHAADTGADAWIFKTPITIHNSCDFPLGTVAGDPILGHVCGDTCIAGLLAEAGYEVINPSLTVKAYHVHGSKVRNYVWDKRLLFMPHRSIPRTQLEA